MVGARSVTVTTRDPKSVGAPGCPRRVVSSLGCEALWAHPEARAWGPRIDLPPETFDPRLLAAIQAAIPAGSGLPERGGGDQAAARAQIGEFGLEQRDALAVDEGDAQQGLVGRAQHGPDRGQERAAGSAAEELDGDGHAARGRPLNTSRRCHAT